MVRGVSNLLRFTKEALRLGLALIFLIAAIGKLLDNRYAANLISQWQLLPVGLTLVSTLAISLAELFLSLWLLSGRYLAKAAICSTIFQLGYTAGTVLTLMRGIRLLDCGCFGIFFPHPLDWTMAVEDFGLTVLSFLLVRILDTPFDKPKNPGKAFC